MQTGLSKYFTKLPNCWIFCAISPGLNNSSWFSDLLTEWEGPMAGNGIKTFDPWTQVNPGPTDISIFFARDSFQCNNECVGGFEPISRSQEPIEM